MSTLPTFYLDRTDDGLYLIMSDAGMRLPLLTRNRAIAEKILTGFQKTGGCPDTRYHTEKSLIERIRTHCYHVFSTGGIHEFDVAFVIGNQFHMQSTEGQHFIVSVREEP